MLNYFMGLKALLGPMNFAAKEKSKNIKKILNMLLHRTKTKTISKKDTHSLKAWIAIKRMLSNFDQNVEFFKGIEGLYWTYELRREGKSKKIKKVHRM